MSQETTEIVDWVLGTSYSDSYIAERFNMDEEEVLELLSEEGLERCKGCDVWFDDGELEEGYCGDC